MSHVLETIELLWSLHTRLPLGLSCENVPTQQHLKNNDADYHHFQRTLLELWRPILECSIRNFLDSQVLAETALHNQKIHWLWYHVWFTHRNKETKLRMGLLVLFISYAHIYTRITNVSAIKLSLTSNLTDS